MTEIACPDRDALRLLLEGKLPSPQAEELEVHLLACARCADAAREIPDDDQLFIAMRAGHRFRGEQEVVAQVIERGRRISSQAETAKPHETLITPNMPQSDGDLQTGPSPPGLDEEIDFLAAPELPDEIGRLGNYRVLQVLGIGGMGVVFRAEDLKLERHVALKTMKPALAASRSAKDRFLREAKATAAIDHDNIVDIYQVGQDRGIPFIAMPFLRGESLQARLDRVQQLDQLDVARIGRQTAEGLAAAHERGLIHRDIKPENIWIEEARNRVKILDFGLARTRDEVTGLTQTGVVLGTPKYMAPEQAKGQSVDHRCDLFSLGSVLYQLATGTSPFAGDSLTATLSAVSNAKCRPVDEVCPQLHPSLARLITRLLSRDRDARPQTAAEVAETLAAIERELDEQQNEQAKHVPLQATETVVSSQLPVVNPIPKRKSKQGKPVFVATTVAVIALAILAIVCVVQAVFKVDNEHGTLIVRIPKDGFSTAFQGQKVTIRNTETDDVYTIDLRSTQNVKDLTPGEYFILETDTGLKVETTHFTIRQGEQEVVDVTWVPKKAKAPVAQPNGALQHVPFDVFYEDPEPLVGIRDTPKTVFDDDRPRILLDRNAAGDVLQHRIVRLWYMSEDLVPSKDRDNFYLPRKIEAWVPSENMPQSGLEIEEESSNRELVCVRPRSRMADGVYCITSVGDKTLLPQFSVPFIVRGFGQPTIDSASVLADAGKAVLQMTIGNKGKGVLNDGRLVITLQKTSNGRSAFCGRFQPDLEEIPAGETRDVQLATSTAKLEPGRYYFTIAVRQTHYHGDQNELIEGTSEEFDIAPNE